MSSYNSDLIKFLAGVSDYFAAHTNAAGQNFCPKHYVEHTGKTGYSIGIDLFLYQQLADSKYADRLKQRVWRVLDLLFETNREFYFSSDGSERWNMSNHIIDSGAVTDMLATVLQAKTDLFSATEVEKIQAVIEKNCETYLQRTVLEKAHTNQRLWGAAALATGFGLRRQPGWKTAVLRSIDMSLQEIRADGSIPYVTKHAANKLNAAIADTTNYYHSRHVAFAWHALEQVGEVTDERLAPLILATDFLMAFYQQDGLKNSNLETKRWYFNSSYEIASNSYDVYAFLKVYTLTKDPKYAQYGLVALEQLFRHQKASGALQDHWGGYENFQCPYFWNSHTAWLTRIQADLAMVPVDVQPELPIHSAQYPIADVVNVATKKYAFMTRGKKQPRTPLWGPRLGGGSLLYFGSAANNFCNELEISELTTIIPANFYTHQGVSRPADMIAISKTDFKRLLYYVLIELRGVYVRAAWYRLLLLIDNTITWRKQFSSAYDTGAVFTELGADTIQYKSSLATKAGELLPGIALERTYHKGETALRVTESLQVTNEKSTFSGGYRLPKNATDISIKGDGIVWGRNNRVRLRKTKQALIEYKLV